MIVVSELEGELTIYEYNFLLLLTFGASKSASKFLKFTFELFSN